jgi:hypothetical protein
MFIASLASLDLLRMFSASRHVSFASVHGSCMGDGEPVQRYSLINVPWGEVRVPGLPVPLITFSCFCLERVNFVWSGLPSV